MPLHPAQPLAHVRVVTGVDEGDLPLVDVGAQHLDVAATFRKDEVVRRPLVVAQEEFLDLVRSVAEAQNELVVPVVAVVLHQVPQDRALANVDQRLGQAIEYSRMRMPSPPQNSTTFIVANGTAQRLAVFAEENGHRCGGSFAAGAGGQLGERRDQPLSILCIGAHSDDIEIGCGGTILRLLVERPGCTVRWVVLSADDGREQEARASAAAFLADAKQADVEVSRFRRATSRGSVTR